jgi:hypothetical protein
MFFFIAENGGGHFVCFVTDDKVPLGGFEFFLNFFVSGEFVQPGDKVWVFNKGISPYGRFQHVVGEDFKFQLEKGVEFVLPLLHEITGETTRQRLRSPLTMSSFISSPDIMVFLAPGSSARR